MKKICLLILCWAAICTALQAATLTKLPGPPGMPMTQGGMVHINITFTNNTTNTFNASLDPGTPNMAPLTYWSPGDVLDSADPWYLTLDPTQGAGQFSGRYGFMLDTSASDALPADTSLGIRFVSGTPGLKTFFYRYTSPNTFDEVFTTSHDYVLWSGTMWHPVFVMPASTSNGTTVNATFEMFLANHSASGNVDYSTSASPVSGYETQQFTLTWSAIPEPSVVGCLALGALLLSCASRNRKSQRKD